MSDTHEGKQIHPSSTLFVYLSFNLYIYETNVGHGRKNKWKNADGYHLNCAKQYFMLTLIINVVGKQKVKESLCFLTRQFVKPLQKF